MSTAESWYNKIAMLGFLASAVAGLIGVYLIFKGEATPEGVGFIASPPILRTLPPEPSTFTTIQRRTR